MRRIVQSPTEGSTNGSNHGRLVVTPATRLGGEVQPAAPAFQAAPAPGPGVRPCVRGKFLFVGDEKLYVRGVTYGAFTPDAAGNEYHDLATVERDFAQMAANGINAVRIPHTTPPRGLLDIASHHGLRVMVGLSAEQYVGYLIDRRPGAPDVEALIRNRVRVCARHPALLCYALGNEIPALMARWLGRRKVERYLERLYRIVKQEDPDGLVTYVNYPTTEYLRLPFLDFVCFNVYLESQHRFEAYLARLQNIAGDRPLLMSELGLDALRNGEGGQARSLDWQVRTAFAAGCGGVFVFAWTDEWYRHGHDVEDWAFGLTRADRSPKPALETVREAFAEAPFAPSLPWPRVSVVVCSHNGARTIRDSLEGLRRLEYPDYEVIVVDDGSTDDTAAIAGQYDVRLIRTPNRGLSSARNTGLAVATGEIVAYLDDDAYPDPHWLTYLAATFLSTSQVGVGGPNIAPAGDGPIAECVARAPGGPVHVLVTDREAEHIPGCNMAFRTAYLEAVGGFDPRFRTAGDDVDVCWRLHRLRQGGGDARAQMAGEVQRRWARPLDGPDVRQRTALHPGVAARPRVSRRLGRGAVPVPVRARPHALGVPAPDARVASHDRDAGRDRRAGRRVESAAARTPAARGRDSATDRSGVSWGRPGAVPRRSPGDGAAGAARPHRGTALHSAHRAAARALSGGPHPVAAALPAAAGAALARHRRGVE